MYIPDQDLDELGVHWLKGCAPKPQAMVFLDRRCDGGGTTIAHRDADGALYGCREVSPVQPHHDEVVTAWMDHAKRDGLRIEDHRAVNAGA